MGIDNKPYTNQLFSGRKNNFDFLRFIAASLVIFSHAFPLACGDHEQDILFILTHGKEDLGSASVKIFFIISGFLITQSYDNSKNLLRFLKARILRLYPALIMVIILSAFILGPLITKYSLTKYFHDHELYRYLLSASIVKVFFKLPGVFTHNIFQYAVNGSIWTLRFELFCYIVVAFLGISKLLSKNFILLLFVMLYLAHFYNYDASSHPQIYFSVYFLTYFLSGAVLYIFHDKLTVNTFFAVCCVIALCLFSYFRLLEITMPIAGAYLVIYFAFCPKIKLHNFASRGDFSYGLYIFAFPIQQLISQVFGGSMNAYLNFVISFPIVFVCAIFSWHLVEKRCLRLKKVSISVPMKIRKLFAKRLDQQQDS